MIGKPLEEEWKPIEKTNNTYYVSNLGRVKSMDRVVYYSDGRKRRFPGKPITPTKNKHGYLQVYIGSLTNQTQLVHRLVAKAFIKNNSSGDCINHIDGDKTNNNVENLEWCSIKENTHHALRTGLMKYQVPSKPVVAYKGADVIGVFPSIRECARKLNCVAKHISDILHGRRKTYHGFRFEFVNSDNLDGGGLGDTAVKVVATKGSQVIKAKSYCELAKILGVTGGAIEFALKHGTKTKGYTVRKDE